VAPLAVIWRTRARIVGDRDPRLAAESLILAWLDDGSENLTVQAFQIHRQVVDGDTLEGSCRGLGLSVDQTAEVLALFRRATAGAERALTVLDSHLRQAVGRCRALGSEPVLVSYPWPDAFGESVARSLAEELGVAWVAVHEAFSGARSAEPDIELFVRDGHCNDRGYDLMAEAVAHAVEARLVVAGAG